VSVFLLIQRSSDSDIAKTMLSALIMLIVWLVTYRPAHTQHHISHRQVYMCRHILPTDQFLKSQHSKKLCSPSSTSPSSSHVYKCIKQVLIQFLKDHQTCLFNDCTGHWNICHSWIY
jgi:hypothetical protein